MIDYNQLPSDSRVWIYQSNKAFTDLQTEKIQQKLETFIKQWQSHDTPLKAWAGIKYNRFIQIIVDKSHEAPSGCSIDSSVTLIKSIEEEMQVDMFDRLNFTYKSDTDSVLSASRPEFSKLYASGAINDNTTVFNNLVSSKAELELKWEIALSDSWHSRMV
ncbi:hypothetical protein OAK19_01355 [Aureispira]|nr:hypothetical protein [Aureispira sp.]